jgi:hypothetical protein
MQTIPIVIRGSHNDDFSRRGFFFGCEGVDCPLLFPVLWRKHTMGSMSHSRLSRVSQGGVPSVPAEPQKTPPSPRSCEKIRGSPGNAASLKVLPPLQGGTYLERWFNFSQLPPFKVETLAILILLYVIYVIAPSSFSSARAQASSD